MTCQPARSTPHWLPRCLLAQAEEPQLPVDATEGLGERLRASLVLLDVNLPAIALPDGVHGRSFTGAPRPPILARPAAAGAALQLLGCLHGKSMGDSRA